VTPVGSTTAVTTATAAGLWTGNAVGLLLAQARMSSYASGAAQVSVRAVLSSPGGGSGGGGGGGGAVTIADGADVTQGAVADSAATNSTGSWSVVALLKGIIGKCISLVAQILDYDSGAGTANQVIFGIAVPASGGPVAVTGDTANGLDVDVTRLPSLGNVATTVADGANVVEGATTGAAIITDVDGTIQRYLRGIVKLAITAGGWLVTSKSDGFKNAMWYVHHIPAANTVATITQASAGGSTKNVCTGFTVTLAAQATAPTANQITVSLIDGATGGTTYLWRSVIAIPATAGAVTAFVKTGAWFVGTAATAMTLEFSAAGGANTIESVSMSGTTTL
jgi:hypothetical protein